MGKYAGDLSDDRRFIAFLELFSSTDFFRLALGEKEYLYQRRPASFFDLYFDLMDRMAEQENNRFWLCKLDPSLLIDRDQRSRFIGALHQRYESIRFVHIRRENRDVLRSYLRMEGKQSIHSLSSLEKHLALVVQTARQALLDASIEAVARKHDVLCLHYSDLKGNMDAASERVGRYLGLEDAIDGPRNPYRPNSSFTHGGGARGPAAAAIWIARKPLYHGFLAFPFAARAVLNLRERRRPQHLPFYWRLLRAEKMPDGLSRELLRTGQVALHDQIFGDRETDERTGPSTRMQASE